MMNCRLARRALRRGRYFTLVSVSFGAAISSVSGSETCEFTHRLPVSHPAPAR